MPTYQYACTGCDHDFEAVQAFTDDSLTECPQCHGRLRKVFGAVGIVFKGSGFYRTDSRDTKAADDSTPKPDAGASSSDASTKDSSSTGAGISGGASSDTGASTPTKAPSTTEAKPAKTVPAAAKPSSGSAA